jgi:hypothetical protein
MRRALKLVAGHNSVFSIIGATHSTLSFVADSTLDKLALISSASAEPKRP